MSTRSSISDQITKALALVLFAFVLSALVASCISGAIPATHQNAGSVE